MEQENKLVKELELLYSEFENNWVKKNSLILHYARNRNLVIGGSIAMGITTNSPFKLPGDIDLFTNNQADAVGFLTDIIEFLTARGNVYYKILVNNRTKFTLNGVTDHMRILVPFWKPICIMTLSAPIRKFYWNGLAVQYYDDVKRAAREVEKIDGKQRVFPAPWEDQDEIDDGLDAILGVAKSNIEKVSIEYDEQCLGSEFLGTDPDNSFS